MKIELIAVTQYLREGGSPEELLEFAGRVCYHTEPCGNPRAFLQARIREGHESLIEHASASFLVEGISRACSHQLVRHRLASYSQESQRYVEMTDIGFLIPEAIAGNSEALAIWEGAVQGLAAAYGALREKGVRKEDARFLLPNATPTCIIVTMNFRELRHFFEVRCHKAAQWEIRALATMMLELICPYAPAVFEDLHQRFRRETS